MNRQLDPVGLANARKVAEEAIEQHATAILQLKGYINTLTPAARLPSEMLAEIFVHVARDNFIDREDHFSPSRRVDLLDNHHIAANPWINVAHVCHSWREIALETPRLWGFILASGPRWIKELRLRSKNAPLLINARLPSNDSSATQTLIEDILTKDGHRLEELLLCATVPSIHDLCRKLQGKAPVLDKLGLFGASDANGHHAPMLPHLLTQQSLPRLRHLSILSVPISWTNPILCSSLSTLHLSTTDHERTRLGSFTDFLHALENMKALQELTLAGVVPEVPVQVMSLPTPCRTISFPSLTRLSLGGDALDCANAFNHFVLPARCELHVMGYSSNADRGSKVLLTLVRERLLAFAPPRVVSLTRAFGDSVGFSAHWDDVDILDVPSVPAFPVSLEMKLSAPDFERLLQDHKLFDHVHSIRFIGSPFRETKWEPLFASATQLRVLSIDGEKPSRWLLPALLPQVGQQGESEERFPHAGEVPVARLEVLKLSGVRLAYHASDNNGFVTNAEQQVLDLLIDCLLARASHECPLRELHLTNVINVAAADIDRLRVTVPVVRWDGVVSYDEW